MIILLQTLCFQPVKPVKADVSGTFTLYPNQDTITSMASPDSQVWNVSDQVQVGEESVYTNDRRYFWLQFDLDEVSDKGALTITSAYLYVYNNWTDFGDDGVFPVYAIDPSDETWDDGTITWNTQPTLYVYNETDNNQNTIENFNDWYNWQLCAGNATRGIQALQTAYDGNLTKTFCLAVNDTQTTYYMFQANTADAIYNRPRLVISYTATEGSTGESNTPFINNPIEYTFTYFVDADAALKSNFPELNFGYNESSQISWNLETGVRLDQIYRFNLTTPDLVNGIPVPTVDWSFNLGEWAFDIHESYLIALCDFAPEIPDYIPRNRICGIERSSEEWSEHLITFNTKPDVRTELDTQIIDVAAWTSYNLTDDEDFIRETVSVYNTTYSLQHSVAGFSGSSGYSSWLMKDSEDFLAPYPDGTPIYIEMNIIIDVPTGFTTETEGLTMMNPHIKLAAAWTLTPFIAGNLWTLMLFMVIVVPIRFITRKIFVSMAAAVIVFILAFSLGWIGVYIFLTLIVVLSALTGLRFLKK